MAFELKSTSVPSEGTRGPIPCDTYNPKLDGLNFAGISTLTFHSLNFRLSVSKEDSDDPRGTQTFTGSLPKPVLCLLIIENYKVEFKG